MGALLLAACAPQFPGTGAVQQYSGADCKVVLVAGDSIANEMAPHLQGRLAATGRCATVVNHAYPGSSSGDWVPVIGSYLDEVQPDVMVIELIGNEGTAGPRWSDPAWLSASATNAALITDAALPRRQGVLGGPARRRVLLPVGAVARGTVAALGVVGARAHLPTIRTVGIADWRTPFGGEVYTPQFVFPDGGVRTLRQNDCVHLTHAGAAVAADATVYAIQHEWRARRARPCPNRPYRPRCRPPRPA